MNNDKENIHEKLLNISIINCLLRLYLHVQNRNVLNKTCWKCMYPVWLFLNFDVDLEFWQVFDKLDSLRFVKLLHARIEKYDVKKKTY